LPGVSSLFAPGKFFLPDIGLLDNGHPCAGCKFPMAWYCDEPPFLLVPEVDMADRLFYGAIAEQDKDPDNVIS
jgi:hypothetical protein